jgi:hypothetical protein
MKSSEFIVESVGTTLYHVTRTATVPKIQKKGITGANPTNFVKAAGGDQYGNIGEIFAMTSKKDAARWAAKWEWELAKKMGSGIVSIVSFNDDPKSWEVDDSDPLSQASNEGKWLKKKGWIKPEQITGAEPVTMETVKAAARW